MSKIVGDVFVIESEEPQRCELCGAVEECRPYGPNGEQVCFPCGMKDEGAAVRAYRKRLALTDMSEPERN